jgi:hypothetical protein
MTIARLKSLIALCKAEGVVELQLEGTRLVFGPPAPTVPRGTLSAKSDEKKKPKARKSDEERFLFAATEGFEPTDEEEQDLLTHLPPPPGFEVKQ